jgi:hypothetical protein
VYNTDTEGEHPEQKRRTTMANIKKIEAIRVELPDLYYVDIFEVDEYEDYREFWLCKKDFGIKHFMFGIECASDQEAVTYAVANAPDYIDLLDEDEE